MTAKLISRVFVVGLLLLVGVLLVVRCSNSDGVSNPEAEALEATSGVFTTLTPASTAAELPEDIVSIDSDTKPPEDTTWISPGKVFIEGLFPGARAEWTLVVHNGNDEDAPFLVAYKEPSHVEAGYELPVAECPDWLVITETTPVLAPKETRDILMALDIPEDAAIPADKWELWVSVKDASQEGTVQTQLASRVLVSMQ
jgi:hypothetical protein